MMDIVLILSLFAGGFVGAAAVLIVDAKRCSIKGHDPGLLDTGLSGGFRKGCLSCGKTLNG